MLNDTKKILLDLKNGRISVDEALSLLKTEPFRDIGIAKVDTHRSVLQGNAEVIYGESKTAEQISAIISEMKKAGEKRILITRLSEEKYQNIDDNGTIAYYSSARMGVVGENKKPDGLGTILVLTAGTSDIPVAEEAAVTAEFYGNKVERIFDVGVSGLHRLLSHVDRIVSASVIIVCAGMEGALASVVGGLADCPVIALPTSVGYGASYQGVTALLSMLNSCASGVGVVNIDNGFGAGYLASVINHMEKKNENTLS